MTEIEILHWIRETSLGEAVRESRWIFATGETFHFFGLSLLVGGLLIVDLRLLGFHPPRPGPGGTCLSAVCDRWDS